MASETNGKSPVKTNGDVRSDVQIIPLKPLDQWRPLEEIRSLLFLVVRENLNEEAMRDSLDRLIREHLPLIGARIELKKSDLEYRFPKPFPPAYLLFEWTNKTIDSSLGDTSLLPQAPQSDSGPSFASSNILDMEREWTPSTWPVERKFEKPDAPLLFVHITKYTDSTIVALNLPHSVSDQLGFGSMINAWMQVLNGETPPEFVELSVDALDGPKLSQKELRMKGKFRILSSRERATKIIPFIPGFVRDPKEVRKTLFLPVNLVDDLRERCMVKLKAKYGEDAATLSNADVITAILAKFAFLSLKDSKMVTLSTSLNIRGRHPALPADKPYLHNGLSFVVSRLPVAKTPLAEVAYKNRLAVNEGLKLTNIERSLAVSKEMYKRQLQLHVIEPPGLSYAITNWCGAWRELDFGPAVVRTEDSVVDGGVKGSAIPLVFGHSLQRHLPTRFNGHIMCKAGGGYWCDFTAIPKTIAKLESL
ncbi:BCL5p protein [Penicillium cataractarum]|uniref:BCL5p protein n=1 Tax=Penicillium cataractarum TaxID=2100454 RepID=A0A9W9V861_9EURO|nr:BCL5p protein [Penicillium cataractarum]KAJ5369881.1 BCL5p protein [Penicillium cataractarum]